MSEDYSAVPYGCVFKLLIALFISAVFSRIHIPHIMKPRRNQPISLNIPLKLNSVPCIRLEWYTLFITDTLLSEWIRCLFIPQLYLILQKVCNIADLLIYSLLVKSMTTFIIFIFFMISIPFAPNDTYSPFLVDFPFFTIQGTCRPAVNNIPIEKQLV